MDNYTRHIERIFKAEEIRNKSEIRRLRKESRSNKAKAMAAFR